MVCGKCLHRASGLQEMVDKQAEKTSNLLESGVVVLSVFKK